MNSPIDINAYQDAVRREKDLAAVLGRPVRVTWILLAINVLIWIAGFVWGQVGLGVQGVPATGEQLSFYPGMKVNELVWDGQWWRLISSQYIHLNMMHMLFNGYGLYVLGPILEKAYGAKRFFAIYMLSGTLGALASLWFTSGASGGASGAIYGLVGGIFVFGWKYRGELPRRVSRSFTTQLLPWVGFSLAIGFLDFLPMDNAAHLGGLMGGAATASLMASNLRTERPRAADLFLNLFVWTSLIILLGTAAAWALESTRCLGGPEAFQTCYPDLLDRLESP